VLNHATTHSRDHFSTKENLLDSLSTIELLKDEKIRKSVFKAYEYKASHENFEETVELRISEVENGFDRITCEIEVTPETKHRSNKAWRVARYSHSQIVISQFV
jgi:hypothetical protein